MMDYDMFRMTVKENIKDYLPPEYGEAVVKIHSVNKVNAKKDALAILKDEGQGIAANLYLEEYFKIYEETGDLQMVLSDMAEEYCRIEIEPFNKPVIDLSQMKDKAVMMLVNTEQNRELLADVPHREFQDLSVIYRYVVSADEQGIASFIIKNEYLDKAGITPEELFQCAAENTRKMFPPKIASMEEVMQKMFQDDEIIRELAGFLESETDVKETMWIISNSSGINGAVSMLYDENLHMLAEKVGTDLFIMPSSVNEVMAVSVEMADGNPEKLAEIVQDANMSEVPLGERLSNNVYHYDKDLRKLSLATDVPNKRLDGIVAEPELIYNSEPKR